jgi:hypothetical protein
MTSLSVGEGRKLGREGTDILMFFSVLWFGLVYGV